MSEKQTNKINARRNLLKGIAAGSGAVIAGKALPESWSRPVVDSVMLPVHAQTSGPASYTGASEQASIDTNTLMAGLLGGLVKEAHAEPDPVTTYTHVTCIRRNTDGTVRVDTVLTSDDGGYTMSAQISAANVIVDGAAEAMSGINCEMQMKTSLLDGLGLVPDAHAGFELTSGVTVEVDSINGRAIGRYLMDDGDDSILEFDLPAGDCSAPECPVEL